MTTGPTHPGPMPPGESQPGGHDTDAKLSLQRRRQLSALVDGDLAPDQARFLLRRLGHDAELAGRWQRWQLIGDVLRGQPVATLPDGTDAFAAQVAAAVARERPPAVGSRRPRWQHVAALAASVAVVALFVTRPPSGDSAPAAAPPVAVVGIDVPAAAAETTPPEQPLREVSVPQFAEAPPAADAGARPASPVPDVSDEPRRARDVALASASPAEAGAPEDGVSQEEGRPPALVLATADAGTPGARPFATPDEPQARPWPRAALPDLARPASAGRFTVDFGDSAPAPSFYPFEPQLPAGQPMPETETDAASGDPASDQAGDQAGNPERTP